MSNANDKMRQLLAKYDKGRRPNARPPTWRKKPAPRTQTPVVKPARQVRAAEPPKTTSRFMADDRTNMPLADFGLTSYRYKGRYGWIMIGAKNHKDALVQAGRSTDEVAAKNLQIWDGTAYVPATTRNDVKAADPKIGKVKKPRAKYNPNDDYHDSVHTLISKPPKPPTRHQVPGFYWIDVRGTPVLMLEGLPLEESEFVAVPSDPGKPLRFTIVSRLTQKAVWRDIESKHLLQTVRQTIRRAETEAERGRAYEAQERERATKLQREQAQAEQERLHAHAFYLTATATSPEEPLCVGDDLAEIVEEAYGVMRKHPEQKPLTIIEAENEEEAMKGMGHVWWKDGLMKGPPVDPRQKGFGW